MMKKIGIVVVVLAVVLTAFVMYARKTPTSVRIEHTFAAPVEKVWTLWNDPESMKKWWGPEHFSAPLIQNDPRTGGSFLLAMEGPDGKVAYNAGVYTEVIPNQKLAARMWFADETGKMIPAARYGVPGEWPDEVTVTVEFKADGERTHVTIVEAGLPLIISVFAKMGWSQQFDKFDALLK